MKVRVSLLSFAFCLALVCATSAEDKKDPSKGKAETFRALTYDKALETAKSEKKVVMVDFYADWCGPCKQMDAKTFSEEKVSDFLKSKTIAIKINIDNNKELAKKYKITAIPCFVFIDGEGTEVGRVLGFRASENFLKEAGKFTAAK